jgi:hypothetical protein
MPSRILREGYLDSEHICALDPGSETLFVRLLLVADDFGRFDGRLPVIRARCYPISEIDAKEIERRLLAVAERSLILRYEVSGKPFIVIPNFKQRTRAMKSKFPPPPADLAKMTDICPSNGWHTTDTRLTDACGLRVSESESESESGLRRADNSQPVDNFSAQQPKPSKPLKPRKPKPLPEEIPKPEPPKTGWWDTDPGVIATAKTLNLPAISGETVRALKERCFAEIERMKSANAVPLPTIQPPSCAHCGTPFANGGFTSMSGGNVCNPCYAAYLRSEWQPAQPDQPHAPLA